MKVVAAVSACVLLGACATIIEGKTQQIFVNTNPTGAACGLYRQGVHIATIQSTPASTLIEKSKYDMWVACVKSGYQMAIYFNHSGAAGATFGNIILGGGIGWAVDSATGSDNKYDSPVNITLVPNQPGQPEGPMTLPETFMGTPPVQAPAPAPAPALAPAPAPAPAAQPSAPAPATEVTPARSG